MSNATKNIDADTLSKARAAGIFDREPVELTLEQARAAGFVIDYPEHPRGVGCPIGRGIYGGNPYPQRFDRFFVHRACPFAGWLKRDDIAGTGTPAFKVGKTRDDARAYVRSVVAR